MKKGKKESGNVEKNEKRKQDADKLREKERFTGIKMLFATLGAIVSIIGIFNFFIDFYQIRKVTITNEIVLPLMDVRQVESLGSAASYLDTASLKEMEGYEKGCLYDIFLKNENSKPKTIESWTLNIKEIRESQIPNINVFPIVKDNKIIFYCINDSNVDAQDIYFTIGISSGTETEIGEYLDIGYETPDVYVNELRAGQVVEVLRIQLDDNFDSLFQNEINQRCIGFYITDFDKERFRYRMLSGSNCIAMLFYDNWNGYVLSYKQGDSTVVTRNVPINTKTDEGKEFLLPTSNTQVENEEEFYICILPNCSCEITYNTTFTIDKIAIHSEEKTTEFYVPLYEDSDKSYSALTDYLTNRYNGEPFLDLLYDSQTMVR